MRLPTLHAWHELCLIDALTGQYANTPVRVSARLTSAKTTCSARKPVKPNHRLMPTEFSESSRNTANVRSSGESVARDIVARLGLRPVTGGQEPSPDRVGFPRLGIDPDKLDLLAEIFLQEPGLVHEIILVVLFQHADPLRVGEEPPLGDERPVAVEEEGVEERAPPHFRPTAFRIASVNAASVDRPERREETFPSRP